MRKSLLAAAVTVAVLVPSNAQAQDWRRETCRYQGLTETTWSLREVALTIRCAASKWSVPGGVREALYIARRESGLRATAANPSSSAAGVYQFVSGTWSSVKARWRDLMQRWSLHASVYNARANVLLAIRKAHADGWGAWTTA